MELNQAHQELDGILPTDLRGTADIIGLRRSSEGSGTSGSQSVSEPITEDATMSATNTTAPVILTNEQVVAAAQAEVKRILAEQNSEVQVATLVERHMAAANTAQSNLATAQAELAAAKAELTKLRGGATQENSDVPGANKDAKDWHGTTPAAYAELQKQVTELTSALAAVKKKMDDDVKQKDWNSKKADRLKKMKDSKVKSKKFGDRATASNADGSLTMDDNAFESALAEFIENIEVEGEPADPATAADTGGNPIPAPVDKTGPADKSKHPSLVGKGTTGGAPVAAPKTETGPAAKQKSTKIAHASQDGVTEPAAGEGTTEATPVQAAASAVPSEPDLTTADIMAQATAAILSGGGPAATATGKKNYANAFGI